MPKRPFGKPQGERVGYRGHSFDTSDPESKLTFSETENGLLQISNKHDKILNSDISSTYNTTESFTQTEENPESLHKRKTGVVNYVLKSSNNYLPHKILKCRIRFKRRRNIRKVLESTVISKSDDRPFIKVGIFDKTIIGLLDSGANVSVLGKNCLLFVENNNIKFRQIKSSISTADGSRQEILGFCNLPVCFKGVTKNIVFYLVPSLSQEAYFGIDFWKEFALAPTLIPPTFNINSLVVDDEQSKFHILSPEQNLSLDKTILKFPSYEKLGLGCTDLVQHHIDTSDAVPIKSKHFPLSPPRQEEAYQEIERLLSMGVIEESNSPWCSPVVLVRKPGKVRLCVDSRKLNAVTKKDSYPLPHINGLLSRLHDTYFITGIDLKDAFLQIKLTESSKEKTAFVVPGKPLYHYTKMPFGLCNGPQTMSRLMDRVIPSRLRENVFIYLDDLLVCTSDFDTHIKILNEVAECLSKAKLTINVEKSKFCQKEIKYLGYIVGNGCLKVNPERIKSIEEFPLPKTPRQVRRFVGMANWYRSFINNFADLAGPLTDCLKKTSKPFPLTESAKESFSKLKEALSTAPVLAQPDFKREFIIQCDASKIGVGGVLFQCDNNGKEHPIAYVSQKLNRAQRNYTVTELECMAAIVCVNRFRPYIEGLPFKIITDHSSLRWLMSQRDLSGRLARWSLKLQRYDFSIEHRKGSLNIVPDTLSRMDVDEICVENLPVEIDLSAPDFSSDDYNKLRDTFNENKDSLPDICLSDGFIYKRVKFREGAQDEEESLWRLWIPQSLIQIVLKANHCSQTACHGGYTKTLSRIRQKYYWPTMTKDIKNFVADCDKCKMMKSSNQVLKPPMGNAFVTTRPFERLYCDFLGPYPATKSKNTIIFICLDHFTKYLFLKAFRAATSANIILYFQTEVFPTFGVPKYIHSDNGKQFVSNDMKEFLKLYGIEHIKTGFYAPQSNASERANREIITKLRCFLEDQKDHTNWDKYIPQILTILRSDFHTAIQCTPYYATFGQNMCQHGSTYKILEKLGLNFGADLDITNRPDKLFNIREKIRSNLEAAHEKATKNYNLRSRPRTFQKGQIVFRKNHILSNLAKSINSKFMPKFLKCRVTKRIGTTLYDLEDMKGKYIGRFHASDMKP